MASTVGLVPITRAYLAKFYDKYPYTPVSTDISSLCSCLKDQYTRMEAELAAVSEENRVAARLEFPSPHKIDENLWKNREQIEEILYLLDQNNWPASLCQYDSSSEKGHIAAVAEIVTELSSILKEIEGYQARSSKKVFNMVLTYMPQDFRGSLLKQQQERSERRRQAEVESLLASGGSIHDKYALLWKQQMDRRRTLALLGAASGVYKTVVKYLVGVPQVLLDFVRQINDHHGPMEEQRERYGPSIYQLTALSVSMRIFLLLWWKSFNSYLSNADEFFSLLQRSVKAYVVEMKHFLDFLGDVFEKSPFLISAEEARSAEGFDRCHWLSMDFVHQQGLGEISSQQIDDFKETIIATGKTHEVILTVDCEGSLVAWDFRLTSGKDIGFSVEYIDGSGAKLPILPYQRHESHQGSFSSPSVGSYKLIWDNTYSTFYRKSLRYKVDAIPPVIEAVTAEEAMAEPM